MNKRLVRRNSIFLILLALMLFLVSCTDPNNEGKTTLPSPPPANTSLPAANSNVSANQVTLSPDGFSTNNICSIPKGVAGRSPFANLGGGKWEKWGDTDGELDHACSGGSESIKLEDRVAKITARYGAMGGERTAHYVSAKYTSLQYGGKTPVEEQLRLRYLDFCNDLSKNFYGQKLSEKFAKRLSDESTYSTTGAANEYHEKVGNGYVNLAAKKEKDAMITLEVRFFASEAEYKKYKDS